jgi:putative toxin-antitoxin system antitoxin component (TIGR02293 family)
MTKKPKTIKPYPSAGEETLPIVEEAAVQYQSLRVMLGGNKTIKKNIAGDFDLIAITREGIKKSTLKSLATYLGITMFTMSRLLHTSHRNLQRKDEEEMLDSLKTEKVLELAAFAQRGIDVIGSRDGFTEWLKSPLTSLGNKTPLDFLDTSFGIHLVAKILGRLEQGVYS